MGALEKEKLADLAYESRRVARDRERLLQFDPASSNSELFALQRNTISSLRLPPNSRVLDYGAGTSEIGEWMASDGHRVAAVELSHELLSVSQERTRRRNGIEPGYVVGDCERLPLGDSTIDLAVCWAILHHLPNPDRGAQEIFRVLRKGGSCILVEPNSLGPHRRVREWMIRRSEGIMETSFYPWVLKRIFTQAGFHVDPRPVADFRVDLKHRSGLRNVLHRVATSPSVSKLGDMLFVTTKP